MTWPRLILFALLSGLIALLVPQGYSIRQIAVTFEAWIVLAILVVTNCDKPLEAALKTFVYFLLSQPLVYLIQVPFNSLGFGLFKYYYPYWFYWTLATLPGGWIAWHIKRDGPLAALVLSVALGLLIVQGCEYLKDLLRTPPRFLLAAVFCFGAVPLLILGVLRKRSARLIAAGIAALALAACLFLQFRGGPGANAYGVRFGVDREMYPVTSEWTVRLAEPDNGSAFLTPGDEILGATITVSILDPSRSADVILVSPEGEEFHLPATVETDGNGVATFIY